ncbi:putative short-chain dehydrogenase [Xylariaceae sp. FL0016]|nr:putative short-chain dehydrogenase [Xylariaceae sp. FL0016]
MTPGDPFNPYAEAHIDPKRTGDARPTAIQIIEDERLIGVMAGRVMLVTEMDILESSTGSGRLGIILMYLGSVSSVREGVKDFLTMADRLNVLVNNAGVRNTPEGRTTDGFETQFGINHPSHFLLLQHPLLPLAPYAESKTANILMANQIERLHGASGIDGLSVHPGCIRTELQRYDMRSEQARDQYLKANPVLQKVLKDTMQGAATQVSAAVGKVWEDKGAVYLEDCRKGHENDEPDMLHGGYKSYVFVEEAQSKLRDLSCQLVDI